MKRWIPTILFLMSVLTSCRHSPALPVGPPVPAIGSPVTLAAGTTLAFITAQDIDLSSSRPGQTFAVVVSRDADDPNGQTVLPSGSPAILTLLGARPEGSELGLASAMLNGDAYLARKQAADKSAVAEGASLGVFLGGVAAPQRNASLPSQLTPGAPIKCAAGSLLTFRLDQSIELVGSNSRKP